MPTNPVHNDERCALFLDVDGTLLELAATPQGVQVSERLKELLVSLSARLGGALALVSGRSIADLDHLFAPLRLSASGIHGSERRDAEGAIIRPRLDQDRIEAMRRTLRRFVVENPGLLLEDKGLGIAVHYRSAPTLAAQVRLFMNAVSERLGPDFVIQTGKCVVEIQPAGHSKGTSIRAFMEEPPFRGRKPIYLGDDVTDEHGFAAVNALDGISIRVGDAATTVARFRLRCVNDVLLWLERIPLSLTEIGRGPGPGRVLSPVGRE